MEQRNTWRKLKHIIPCITEWISDIINCKHSVENSSKRLKPYIWSTFAIRSRKTNFSAFVIAGLRQTIRWDIVTRGFVLH